MDVHYKLLAMYRYPLLLIYNLLNYLIYYFDIYVADSHPPSSWDRSRLSS
jgi:hypothetical protein